MLDYGDDHLLQLLVDDVPVWSSRTYTGGGTWSTSGDSSQRSEDQCFRGDGSDHWLWQDQYFALDALVNSSTSHPAIRLFANLAEGQERLERMPGFRLLAVATGRGAIVFYTESVRDI